MITNAFKLCESEMISKTWMINFENKIVQELCSHNSKWPYIPDHPYRILITGGSGSGKTNALLNLINNQPGINIIENIY